MKRLIVGSMFLGLGALLWGLASVYTVIHTERQEALFSRELQQQSLGDTIKRSLEHHIQQRLHEARSQIEQALNDPFVQDHNLILFEKAEFVLPRRHRPNADTPDTKQLYDAIINGINRQLVFVPDLMQNEIWGARINIINQFMSALKSKKRTTIENEFRQFLRHRSQFILDSKLDIVSSLATLDLLVKYGSPDIKMMNALLLSGLEAHQGRSLPGLQRQLLQNRNRFTLTEFNFLAERIITLCQRYNIAYASFQLNLSVADTALPDLNLSSLSKISTLRWFQSSEWLIQPESSTRSIGTRIKLKELVTQIQNTLIASGVMNKSETLLLFLPATDAVDVSHLGVSLQTTRWDKLINTVGQRYFYKQVLLLLCAILAVFLLVFALLYQRRKQQLLSLQTQFITAITHELRTPLASIRLLAETLDLRLQGLEQAKDYPARIVKDIDSLAFLVDNVLSYNRLKKGRWILRREPVDLQALIATLLTEMPMYTNKSLTVDFSHAPTQLYADAHMLKLLFLNLLRNACYYIKNDKVTICITIDQADSRRLLILDNGIGIPKSDWQNVFVEFTRLPGSSNQHVRGTGLGLSICRKIMLLHKGDIWINKSSELGTEFVLSFGK